MNGENLKGHASKIIEQLNHCSVVQVYSTALGYLGKKPKVKLLAKTCCLLFSDLLPCVKKQDLT